MCIRDRTSSTGVPTGSDYTAVSMAYDHACALNDSGEISCWGSDGYGQVSDTPGTDEAGGGNLVCTIDTESTDADGHDIDYTFTWTEDGVAYTGTSSGAYANDSVPEDDVDEDKAYTCTVTPNDGHDDGSAGSATWSVDNEAPTISAVTVSPSSGVTSTTSLTCAVTASDPDGDTLTTTYSWTNSTTDDILGLSLIHI